MKSRRKQAALLPSTTLVSEGPPNLHSTWRWTFWLLLGVETLLLTRSIDSLFWQLILGTAALTCVSVVAFAYVGSRFPVLTAIYSATVLVGGGWFSRILAQYELLQLTHLGGWPDWVVTAYALVRYGPYAELMLIGPLFLVSGAAVTRLLDAEVTYPTLDAKHSRTFKGIARAKQIARWLTASVLKGLLELWVRRRLTPVVTVCACLVSLLIGITLKAANSPTVATRLAILQVFAFDNRDDVLDCKMPLDTSFFVVDYQTLIVSTPTGKSAQPYRYAVKSCAR